LKRIGTINDNEEFTQTLINFVFERADDNKHHNYLKAIQFKVHLLSSELEEAIELYKAHENRTDEMTYELGNALQLSLSSIVEKETKITRIEEACECYYHLYQKSDKEIFPLLIQLLRDKYILENDLNESYKEVNENSCVLDNELIVHFILKKRSQENSWVSDEIFVHFLICSFFNFLIF
jgi:succinylglutamate desuccinylase